MRQDTEKDSPPTSPFAVLKRLVEFSLFSTANACEWIGDQLRQSGRIRHCHGIADIKNEQHRPLGCRIVIGLAPALPQSVTNPFAVLSGTEKGELAKTIDNAMRDGVRVRECEYGSQQAGQIQPADGAAAFHLTDGSLFKPRKVVVPILYDLLLNARQTAAERYATLVHELGHLYCGHLGSPNEKYWPHRPGLSRQVEECEAESISYLVCTRLGIQTPSARYVAGYLTEDGEMPKISLDTVVKMAGLIHQMGQSRLPLRKTGKGAEAS